MNTHSRFNRIDTKSSIYLPGVHPHFIQVRETEFKITLLLLIKLYYYLNYIYIECESIISIEAGETFFRQNNIIHFSTDSLFRQINTFPFSADSFFYQIKKSIVLYRLYLYHNIIVILPIIKIMYSTACFRSI